MGLLPHAAIFTGPDQAFEVCPAPAREPQGAEVLVAVTCCTLCGSDLHTYTGRRKTPTPTILGHEILGRITTFGPEAPRHDLLGEPLREGDRITWTIAASCGQCFFCTHDLPQKCERLFKYGHEKLSPAHPLSGGLATYCVVEPGTGIVRVPETLPDAVACPANCATATVAAALRVAGDCQGEVVLVQGAGLLGLTACALARQRGASAVLCVDPREDRRTHALRFGATHLATGEPADLTARVRELTAGRGVDLALELSGATQAHELGLMQLRIGGRSVWVGAVAPTRPIAIEPEMIVRRCLTLHGVHNYAPQDLVTAVRFLARHVTAYPFAELVTKTFPLAEVNEAFRHAAATTAVRVAVVP